MSELLSPRDSGEFFAQIAIQNELLTVEQTRTCLARRNDLKSSGGPVDMEEIVVGMGFMDREQAALVSRGKDYLKARQEDLLLCKIITRNRIAQESDVTYALTLQDALYQHEGDQPVTRVLDLLSEDKVVDVRFIPSLKTALTNIRKALATGEPMPDDPNLDYETGESAASAEPAIEEKPEVNKPSDSAVEPSTQKSEPAPPIAADKPQLVCGRLQDDDRTQEKKVRNLLRPSAPKRVIRRSHPRFEVRDANVHWVGDSLFSNVDLFEKPSTMIDLSLGGLGMRTRRPIAIGEKLKLVVHIPAINNDLELKAEVRNCEMIDKRTQEFQIGVKFLKLKEKVREEMRQLAKDPVLRNKGKLYRYSRGDDL